MSDWPSFTKEEARKVSNVLLSNKVNYWTGNEARKFESEFAAFSNVSYAVAVSNGTAALELALKAIGIKAGDEVIVTPRSFIASVSCVVLFGAKPVFADVDINSGNITRETIKKVISKKTKAIICVHLAGYPCDMVEIVRYARSKSIKVIEDCSQAHGAKIKNKSVGSFGDIGTWSFCQDKIMTTGGEGGMVTTNSKNYWKTIWSYKDHGKNYFSVYKKIHPPGYRWLHDDFGTNMRMTEMQAAIGRIQLKRMKSWNAKRTRNANLILKTLKKYMGIVNLPDINSEYKHAWYKCNVKLNLHLLRQKKTTRESIIQEFKRLGTDCFSGSCSEIYKELAFKKSKLRPPKIMKNAKILGDSTLTFLVHPTFSDRDLKKTCKNIDKIFSKLA